FHCHQVCADFLWPNVASSVRQPRSLVHLYPSLSLNLAGHHFAELLSPPSLECSFEEEMLHHSAFYESNVFVNICQLHTARSRGKFHPRAAYVTVFWRSVGKHEFADWFTDTYSRVHGRTGLQQQLFQASCPTRIVSSHTTEQSSKFCRSPSS
ncbi:TPA: hypothetical protein N0F65_012424, partial [Lagenidium giganteum]